jgi:hypothetical protein
LKTQKLSIQPNKNMIKQKSNLICTLNASVFYVAGYRTLLVSFLAALVSSLINRNKSVSAADSCSGDTRFDEWHRIPTPVSERDTGEDSSDSDEVASQDNFQEVNYLSLMFKMIASDK